jgi:hypothetical protein
MLENKEDSENLNVRCPMCRQRFSVAPEFMDRTVECGGCEKQFRITEETLIHSKKVYPGEKKDTELNQFRRIPIDSVAATKDTQAINYADFNHPVQIGPASPQRVIAGISGVTIMLFGALILFVASKPQSLLGGMPLEKKLIFAGFTSLLGFIFLLYANPLARMKASICGILLATGIFTIPFYIKEPAIKPDKDLNKIEAIVPLPVAPDPLQALRERFLTQPIEKEQKLLDAKKIDKSTCGIYLTDMLPRNKLNARDYLVRETHAGISSHPYPRNDSDFLVVLTEIEMDFDQVTKIAGKLGKVTETHPEIHVIVVNVDNKLFDAGSADKLNDKTHPLFYDLNRQELQCIELGRIQLAVERLADSDAALLRSDISIILIELLEKPGVTFHDSIARALLKWADDPSPAADAALKILKTYTADNTPPPEHLVRLVANHKNPEAIPTMIAVWETNPATWDKELVKFGPAIESSVLEKITSDQSSLRHTAIKILAEVGTDLSLTELRKALNSNDTETRLLAERAIHQIESR